MGQKRLIIVLLVCAAAAWRPEAAHAGDLKITIPRRSHLTPVQQLNREGVEALQKHQTEKAKNLFYKAYLFDPDDPFTLNNLGYVSELEGQADRAQRFYSLAAKQPTDAIVDRASSKRVEGRPVSEALGTADLPMQVNRNNFEALRLLSQGRAAEAEALEKQALAASPQNVFALNNMGVIKEMEGEDAEALKYYDQAAHLQSSEPAIVTLNRGWRGKPASEMAADSARKLRARLSKAESVSTQVARLNLRGVSAINRNDSQAARKFFKQAYALDPNNAFCLNNLGYLAEMDGDLESAQFFYEKALKSDRADVRVGFATRSTAEGKKLFEVANVSSDKVDGKITEQQQAKQAEQGPIELKRRGNALPAVQPAVSAPPKVEESPSSNPTLGPPQPPIPELSPNVTPPIPPPLPAVEPNGPPQ